VRTINSFFYENIWLFQKKAVPLQPVLKQPPSFWSAKRGKLPAHLARRDGGIGRHEGL
jgi:hypothetical protein